MFLSLVRMMGLTGVTARTSNVAAKGFSLRLESLDGRVMPSTLHVAAGFDATPAAVRSVGVSGGVDNFGGLAGGVLAGGGSASIHSSHGVDNFGGLAGGVLAGGGSASAFSTGGDVIDGGSPGGVLGDRTGMAGVDAPIAESSTRSSGEEIPQ